MWGIRATRKTQSRAIRAGASTDVSGPDVVRRLVVPVRLARRARLLAVTVGALASAVTLPAMVIQHADEAKPIRIDHQTPHIGTGTIIGGFYRIEVQATIRDGKGVGQVRFDGTLSALDEFGDRLVGRHALTEVQVRLTLLDRVDSSGRGRRLYDVEVVGARPNGPCFFLVCDREQKSFKLIVKDGREHTAICLTPKDEDLQARAVK